MKKLLYFTCPTDYLETIIDNTFKQENYYYNSLGNSITFSRTVVRQLTKLIREREIEEIVFVLSNTNRIVLDGLGNQEFSGIRGLNNFYRQLLKQKEYSEMSWQTWNRQFSILSYYLNTKIQKLQLALDQSIVNQLTISGKIYNRQERLFKEIHSDLICREYAGLN